MKNHFSDLNVSPAFGINTTLHTGETVQSVTCVSDWLIDQVNKLIQVIILPQKERYKVTRKYYIVLGIIVIVTLTKDIHFPIVFFIGLSILWSKWDDSYVTFMLILSYSRLMKLLKALHVWFFCHKNFVFWRRSNGWIHRSQGGKKKKYHLVDFENQ